MIECLLGAPEGAALLERHPALARWWDRMAARPSLPATAPA
jgi:glutathione S-transferase